jgi:hypothetical protein
MEGNLPGLNALKESHQMQTNSPVHQSQWLLFSAFGQLADEAKSG